jgi:SWI/SNF-related matrix-associated actin-dependent regulator of chromatin subfamily A-like protein 1
MSIDATQSPSKAETKSYPPGGVISQAIQQIKPDYLKGKNRMDNPWALPNDPQASLNKPALNLNQPPPPPPPAWPTLPPMQVGYARLALPRRATVTLLEILEEAQRQEEAKRVKLPPPPPTPKVSWQPSDNPAPLGEFGGRWVAENSYDIHWSLKEDEWKYNGDNRTWWTRDPEAVLDYRRHMDVDAKLQLNYQLGVLARNYERSFATDNPWLRPFEVTPDGAVVPHLPQSNDKQEEAYSFQTVPISEITLRNLLITDEMGLGKTIEAIMLINQLYAEGESVENVLIIVPNTMYMTWVEKLQEWLNPEIIAEHFPYIWPWSRIAKEVFEEDIDPRSPMFGKLTDKVQLNLTWDLVIVDEAHYAKNISSKRAKAFRALKAKHRVCLTGTPILGKPTEIWPIADWVQPGVVGTQSQFESKYEIKTLARVGWRQFYRTRTNLEKIEALQIKLRKTIMIGRQKSVVLTQLPAKQRSIVEIDYGTEVQKIEKEISRLFAETRRKVKDIEIWSNIFKLRHDAALLKVPKTCELIKDIWMERNGDQVDLDLIKPIVIFCYHKDVMAQIVDFCRDEVASSSERVVSISGSQNPTERSMIISQFQRGDYDILVAGLTVAGVGITLTRADVAVFAELDWTPANLIQAEDRLHRIGQESAVNIYYTVSQASIDGRFAKILGKKQEVIDAFTNPPEVA